MGLELCSKCGRMHYRTDPCAAQKSTAALKDSAQAPRAVEEGCPTRKTPEPERSSGWGQPSGNQAPPVDTIPMSYVKTEDGIMHFEAVVTIKRGRPRIHPDRKAYKAQKERERRARLKDRQ